MLENLKTAIKKEYTTSKVAARAMEMDPGNLSKIVNSDDPGSFKSPTLNLLSKAFPTYNLDWLLFDKGPRYKTDLLASPKEGMVQYGKRPEPDTQAVPGDIQHTDNESDFIDIGHGQYIMIVELVPVKAQAGYIEHYSDEPYLKENFDKHSFVVSKMYRGKYRAFIVEGDSMNNGTDESIKEGYIVTGRVIQRHYWKSKFHIHKYQDYVIVHKDGIFTKRITKHDVEKGIITCHSLNPDKDRYPDFELNLDDCLQVFNIVSITQPR